MSGRIGDVAYLLHKRNYSESSYIIDLFTNKHGIVPVIAKGARNPKSKFYLNLQLFSCLEIALTGNSDLMTLTGVEVKKTKIPTSQVNIFCGYYVNELLLRLLHKHDQHHELFDFYDKLMQDLADTNSPEPLLRLFEMKLLEEIGYGLDYGNTVSGEPVIDDAIYIVLPEEGVLPVRSTNSTDLLVSGATLRSMASGVLSDKKCLVEAKLLMRHLLQYRLGNRPLKSRSLFAQSAGD